MDLATIVKLLTFVGLVAIMLAMGLKVRIDDVATSLKKPGPLALCLVANFVLVPAVTVGLLYLFNPDPDVWMGFLILAVCPGAPVGPPFAAIAKGDVPSAIGEMVILAGLSAFLSPALLSGLSAGLMPDANLHFDYLAIVQTLLVGQMLPLVIGVGIHRWLPDIASRLAKPIGMLANVLLLGVVALVLVNEYESLAIIRTSGWLAMAVLLAASLAIGWLCGGPHKASRKSLAVTTSARNAAVALVIASKNFADTRAVTAVIAYSLVSIFGTLACAFWFATLTSSAERGRGEG
jgi:BASS family bile acid:Na+ symporter